MKEYFNNNKIQSIIFLISLFLIFFFSIIKLDNITFFFCSICANVFLFSLIKYIKEKLDIKISKKEMIFLIGIISLIYIFYIYSILTRKFIYYWDYSCYYDLQLNTIEAFNSSLLNGIRSFVASTWSGEYGNFLSFFPQIIFQFTNKSVNSYIISFVLVFVPYVLYSFTLLIKTLEKYLKINKKNIDLYYYLMILTITLIPLFHGVLILGQPDFFGLTFVFLIVSLTIKYDFKKIEIDRLVAIFLLTFMLTICRRWYIYWTVTYFIIYIVNILISNIKNKKDLIKIIKNMIIYGVIVIILFLITLFPFIKNTILNNYSQSYSFYSVGGAIFEIKNQINHLGILMSIFILGGLTYGIICKEYRKYTISVIIQFLLIIILFTKIQNMGLHHSLQLLILYIYGLSMLLICILNNKNNMKKLLLALYSMVIIVNFIFGYNNINSMLFTDINLKIENDKNYNNIKEITKWLEKNLDENNRGYLITHNNSINPDKLRHFKTPNSNVKKYIPYGSAIIGVHKFPLELFTAKYVMTTTPFEKVSVEEKYNKVFKELVNEGKFKLVKKFNLENNISFDIYERVEPVTSEEKEKYIAELKEESKEFKFLYEDVINSYIIS